MSEKESGTLIGIDYGSSNIGLALGRNGFVQPLHVLSGKNSTNAIHEIVRTALQNKVDKFIVGLPVTFDGKETQQSQKVREFAKMLRIISKKPVEFYEEHSSSKEALSEAIETGVSRRKRQTNDHIAAGIILKRYYENV